jgi:tetratricopeptide (TPR) repeat protein
MFFNRRQKPEDLSQPVEAWLAALAHEGSVAVLRSPSSASDAAALLTQAAGCYAAAGWRPDACRLFEELGQHDRAAPLYEQLGRWEAAADCHARGGQWEHAARCALEAGRADQAAQYLQRAGQALEAAWLHADHLHRFELAASQARAAELRTPADQLLAVLIQARAAGGLGDLKEGAGLLREALEQLRELSPAPLRRQLADRAGAVCHCLRRPDLAAALHASMVADDVPDAAAGWEKWAIDTWGDAVGIPLPLEPVPQDGLDQHT